MTQPTGSKFSELVIKIGDGGSPESFAKLGIAMVSRNWNSSVSTVKDTVPDQTDEDLLVDEISQPSTRTRTASGKGKIDKSQVATFEAALGVVKNYQVSETGVGTWTGPMVLTAFNRTGQRNQTWDVDVTLEQAGEMVFAAA